jgi:hypothetical protein
VKSRRCRRFTARCCSGKLISITQRTRISREVNRGRLKRRPCMRSKLSPAWIRVISILQATDEISGAIAELLLNDPIIMKAAVCRSGAGISDGWIGAGLVRDAVWDHLHGYGQRPVSGMWMLSVRPENCSSVVDSALEETLSRQSPVFNWSVKNQARMHQRNDNEPYCSTANALRYWLRRRRPSRSE